MAERVNHLGQPIDEEVSWSGVERPPRTSMVGQYCRLELLDIDRHASDLFEAFSADKLGGIWTYLFTEPFETEESLRVWMADACLGDDPLFHAVIDNKTDKAVGFATFMRIDPVMGVIEVGNINFAPALQRTPAATEAMFLMMQRVFNELGYRRYEWKCDNLNALSHKAAKRLGFKYEGLFRQALVYKGRNRDTAWFSIINTEWPAIETAMKAWLSAENFDAQGQQRQTLGDFMK